MRRHQNIVGTPDYPGGPYPSNGAYKLNAPITTNSVDWTISPHLLNNVMFGTQGNMEYFYNPSDPHQWAQYGNINLSYLPLITPLIPNKTPWFRNNPVYQLQDTLTWVKGKHTINFGGTWYNTSFHEGSLERRRRVELLLWRGQRRSDGQHHPERHAVGEPERVATSATHRACTRC